MSLIDSKEESTLLSHIVDGLGAAIRAEDVSLGANSSSEFRQVRDIRTNKLVLEAVDEVDLPIFRSWFRYGECITNRSALGNKVNWEPLDGAEESEDATEIHKNAKSKGWYRDFFIDSVEIGGKIGVSEICELDIDEFLRQAYEKAPGEHKEVYMANLEVQELLREVAFDDSWHAQSPDGDFYQDVWDATRRLQDEIIIHPQMPPTDAKLVSEYLRLVRRAVAGVCATSETETNDLHDTLSELAHKYHDPVWRLPALRISSLTGKGRDHDGKEKKYENQADEVQQEDVRSGLQQIRHNLRKVDILSQSRNNWTLSNEDLREQTRSTEDALLSQ